MSNSEDEDNSRESSTVRGETHETTTSTLYEILATSTYSESFEGRLLQSSAKWGVQSIIFRRAGAHPGGISWTFTQPRCNPASLLSFILFLRFLTELGKYHLPYQAAGINCCTEVGIVYTCTVHPGPGCQNRFSVCTLGVHISNGVTTLPSTFIK